MKMWVTQIMAIDPLNPDNGVVEWLGPEVPGLTLQHAQAYCNENELGYCKVIGQLRFHIPCKPNSIEADPSKEVAFYHHPDN